MILLLVPRRTVGVVKRELPEPVPVPDDADGEDTVTGGSFNTGFRLLPSKWPHKPLPQMAVWKRNRKIAQFEPDCLSLGTNKGMTL
jgi:hypothetical protein